MGGGVLIAVKSGGEPSPRPSPKGQGWSKIGLASQYALAGAYQANGQVKEAIALLEEVAWVRERTLAEDHPDRLASQHVLATTFWEGKQSEALQIMRHVVEIQKRVLDEHHPDRISSFQ